MTLRTMSLLLLASLPLPPVWADQTLVSLSNLTGDEGYRQAARDATAYMLAHFQAPCGLLVWGEHAAIADLRTLATPNIEDYQHSQ